MESLSADELAVVLKGHLAPDIIEILRDKKISGSRLMLLSESTLKLFDFDLGHIIDIMAVVNAIKTGTKDLLRNENSGSVSDKTTNASETNSEMSKTVTDSKGIGECETGDESSEEDDDPNKEEAERVLRQYVKSDFIDSLAPYDHLALRRKCSNWLRIQNCGLPTSAKPNLPVPKTALITDETSSKENSPPSKRTKSQGPLRKSSRINLLKPNKSLTQSANTSDKGSGGSRRQLIKPVEEDDVQDDRDGDGDEDDNDSGDTLSANDMYKLPPNLENMKTGEELSSLKPHLPSFDVEEILLKEEKTKYLVQHLKDGYLFVEKIRKMIFRTLVRYVCRKTVDHPTKFTGTMKEGLAKSLVVKYPQFQKLVLVPEQTPWSHIVAHFQNIFKRVLTQLPVEQRPRKGKKYRKKKTSVTSDVDLDLLKTINPITANREAILDGMKKSYQIRVALREKGDSITEIIEKFPHFQHYGGEVISMEFDLMYPNASDMVRMLTPLIPKVLDKYSAAKNCSVKCGLNEMKVFQHLCSMLPHSIDRDASAIPVEKELLCLLKSGKSVEDYVDGRRAKSAGAVQPYLLGITGIVTNDILKYFLVLDSSKIDLGNCTFLRAVDWLFKSYHVFNVHYPISWRNFFRFLQTCVYKVFVGNRDDVIPSAQNLFSKLLSL